MTSTILADSLTPREDREDGFTLIEILVVIIIIGILAAVAIPIFLNQQRTARDSATTSDVKNLATNIETGLVADPTASSFTLSADAADATKTTATITVGTTGSPITISKTKGTVLAVVPHGTGAGKQGQYVIAGYNADGQEYKSLTDARWYDSAKGGITDAPTVKPTAPTTP